MAKENKIILSKTNNKFSVIQSCVDHIKPVQVLVLVDSVLWYECWGIAVSRTQ